MLRVAVLLLCFGSCYAQFFDQTTLFDYSAKLAEYEGVIEGSQYALYGTFYDQIEDCNISVTYLIDDIDNEILLSSYDIVCATPADSDYIESAAPGNITFEAGEVIINHPVLILDIVHNAVVPPSDPCSAAFGETPHVGFADENAIVFYEFYHSFCCGAEAGTCPECMKSQELSLEPQGGYSICNLNSALDSFQMCCSTDWEFGVNTCDAQGSPVFLDHCVNYKFGTCPDCNSIYDCPSNIESRSTLTGVLRQINDVRTFTEKAEDLNQPGIHLPKSGVDPAVMNGRLSDLALGHSCFWCGYEDVNATDGGCPGDNCDDRELLVGSDLQFWLGEQFQRGPICPEMLNYTEIYVKVGSLSELANYFDTRLDFTDLFQGGFYNAVPGAITTAVQNTFLGIGAYRKYIQDDMCVTIILVTVSENLDQVGTAECSGNDLTEAGLIAAKQNRLSSFN